MTEDRPDPADFARQVAEAFHDILNADPPAQVAAHDPAKPLPSPEPSPLPSDGVLVAELIRSLRDAGNVRLTRTATAVEALIEEAGRTESAEANAAHALGLLEEGQLASLAQVRQADETVATLRAERDVAVRKIDAVEAKQLTGRERTELGQLRRFKARRKDALRAVAVAVEEAVRSGQSVTKETLAALLADRRLDVPAEALEEVWSAIPASLRKGRGRPNKNT